MGVTRFARDKKFCFVSFWRDGRNRGVKTNKEAQLFGLRFLFMMRSR